MTEAESPMAPVATLGDLIGSARRSAGAFAQWLEAGDPALHARAVGQLEPGMSLGQLARESIAAFTAAASDEDWVKLISAARGREEDPGLAALSVILSRHLEAPRAEAERP